MDGLEAIMKSGRSNSATNTANTKNHTEEDTFSATLNEVKTESAPTTATRPKEDNGSRAQDATTAQNEVKKKADEATTEAHETTPISEKKDHKSETEASSSTESTDVGANKQANSAVVVNAEILNASILLANPTYSAQTNSLGGEASNKTEATATGSTSVGLLAEMRAPVDPAINSGGAATAGTDQRADLLNKFLSPQDGKANLKSGVSAAPDFNKPELEGLSLKSTEQLNSVSPTNNFSLTFAQQTYGSSSVPTISIPVPITQSSWGDLVADKVVWLNKQNLQSAELTLTPPDLGTLHAKITMEHGKMGVEFTSPSPLVREALENHLPQLRDTLQNENINLTSVSVSDYSGSKEQLFNRSFERQAPNERGDDTAPVLVSAVQAPTASNRMIDYYT